MTPENLDFLPVFVYGTLRTGENNWERLLKGSTRREIPAVLSGFRLYFTIYPFVVSAPPGEQTRVVGNLMEFEPDPTRYATIMAKLDELEGYNSRRGDGLYRRVQQLVTVEAADGSSQEILAWLYVIGEDFPQDYTDEDRLVDGDYVKNRLAKNLA